MKVGYARVSTRDQHLALQLDALRKAGCRQIYEEVVSGARAERPVLQQTLAHLREGDVLMIWKLDGSVAKFEFWAKSKNRMSGIQ